MKKNIIGFIICGVSFGIGFFLGGKMLVSMINDYKMKMNRNRMNMMLLNDWLSFIYSGGSIDKYFLDHGYRKIMIYGNGYIGKRLFQALSGTNIEVIAIMDRQSDSSDKEKIMSVESDIPQVDCIVITPLFFFDEIYDTLQKKTNIPLISLQNVIE